MQLWINIKLNTEPKAKVESEEEQEEDIDIDEMINDIDEMVEDSEQEPKAKEEPKVEPKAKIEPKVEPKAEQKAKIEPKVEPKAKVEPKVEPKAKIEPKVEPKVEPKAKIEPKVEQKIKPNSEQKQQNKGEDVVWAGEWKVLNPNAEFLTDLNYIKVNPLAEKVFYEKPNSKGENIFTGVNFTSDYSKDSINDTVKELKEDYKNILNNDTSSIDAIASAIDPNIVGFLNKNFGDEDAGKECIRKYLNALHGGEKIYNEFPKIIYNLRDIYKSNLDYQQIKNVIKIAKSAKKLNKNLIKIEQDNIIKRSISNLKRIISDSKTKKIEAQSNDKKEKTENKKGIKLRGKEFFEKAMQRAQEKGSKAHFTSKGKISLKDKVKNNITYLKMAGVKIRGYIYDENPLVTNARVNMLKDRIKVPEGTVDEKKALENAENKAKGREQEKEEEQI